MRSRVLIRNLNYPSNVNMIGKKNLLKYTKQDNINILKSKRQRAEIRTVNIIQGADDKLGQFLSQDI